MVRKVKEVLELVDGVADIWTARHCSYFRMTVHWIDKDSLKRCKAAIACVRITGVPYLRCYQCYNRINTADLDNPLTWIANRVKHQ